MSGLLAKIEKKLLNFIQQGPISEILEIHSRAISSKFCHLKKNSGYSL